MEYELDEYEESWLDQIANDELTFEWEDVIMQNKEERYGDD